MLDPFTSLSLAATVVQFIDAGIKLVSKGREIHDTGTSTENFDLEIVTSDFLKLNSDIQCLPGSIRAPANAQSQEERVSRSPMSRNCLLTTSLFQALRDIAAHCAVAGNELTGVLERAKTQGVKSKWKSARQALKTIWNQDSVNAMAERLGRYREQLKLHVLVSIKRSIDHGAIQDDERFDKLDESSHVIIQHLLQGKDAFEAALDARVERITRRLEESELRVLKAIGSFGSSPNERHAATSSTKPSYTEAADAEQIQQRILMTLRFEEITARMDEITVAHPETFQWAFKNTAEQRARTPKLEKWLQSGTKSFWVHGKVGSGKSTFMKFILHDQRTLEALSLWAAPKRFILASYFAWHSGTANQRTHAGLLRTVLYQVLAASPGLIEVALPEVYKSVSTLELKGCNIPGSEVAKGFERLVVELQKIDKSTTRLPTKICLLIDAVDEFDEGPDQVCELIHALSLHSNVKILFAGRPENTYTAAFASSPSFQLQDMTDPDIKLYVHQKLATHVSMRKFAACQGHLVDQLAGQIVGRANGVFLWVSLVVRSLLDGFRNEDSMEDLYRRLDELPFDLQELYRLMWLKMNPLYRQQAAQIFQLCREYGMQQLRTLTLAFAENEDVNAALETPFLVTTLTETQRRCHAIARRLNSRCCGLLEIHFPRQHVSKFRQVLGQIFSSDEARPWASSEIRYCHDSVQEFLHSPSV
jgi:hypothetical protein